MLADWDPRLITPEQALHMAGDWPVYATHQLAELSQFGNQPDRWQVNLRCRKCGQSCGILGQSTGLTGQHAEPYQTSIGDLLSAVLRHMVTAHDWSLSGAIQGPQREPGPPLVVSAPESHARLIDAITEDDRHG